MVYRPYVYRLVHKVTGQFYIGYRCANRKEAHLDLGIKYKTSSKEIKEIGFDNFDYSVILECFNPDRKQASVDAFDIEQELIESVFDDPLCLNGHFHKRNGYGRFRIQSHSEETKEKIRQSNIGVNLGKKHTEESRLNMSKARKGVAQSEEHKRNKNASLVGRKRTEESKARMSEAQTGRKLSEEAKEKMSLSRMGNTNAKGMTHSEDTRAKMSKSRTGKVQSEETKAKRAKSLAEYRARKKLEMENNVV